VASKAVLASKTGGRVVVEMAFCCDYSGGSAIAGRCMSANLTTANSHIWPLVSWNGIVIRLDHAPAVQALETMPFVFRFGDRAIVLP
jgi:hypothetical protein